ncbi:hypothetical protein J4E85_004065 [Alternaria conjuncta]|uniref:uncharacterized protein n=1 Tax=Alternaria conjuncta TaxID=181017 RepID=UPI00221F3B49|nr:uncharacterized protein J4E85_004065 [Alternaria conjuncta]KAI4931472.1 hypothetical protein J4E85_004065 [Alternaria conjuncta]
MSGRPSFSTLRTSVSSKRRSQLEELSQELQDAVEYTTKDVEEDEAQRRGFLPKADLDRILNPRSLELLFIESVSETPSFGGGVLLPSSTSGIANEEETSDPSREDTFIRNCIDATTRTPLDTPSWRALLALFLYQNSKELLSLFLQWMFAEFGCSTAMSDNPIPSDESIPFTKATLRDYHVPTWCHRVILLDQAMFKPVMIQKLEHHDITTSKRLPFMGMYEPIKSGSQGQVFKAEIAQFHWEIRENEDQEDSDFVTGNPKDTKLVALKVFRAVESVRDMPEATKDFEIELDILKELRRYNTKHDMIMLHLGSITELDGAGKPTRHSLIFELANFSLGDLLKGEKRAREDIAPSRQLASLVDIVEALECLHNQLKTLHLDIKPDNILIFETCSGSGSKRQHKLTWKLSDFGLARKRDAKQQRAGSAQTSTATSRTSTQPATRPTGLYQAPEIQDERTSLAGQDSDVWSIGCITLMVLAFIADGSTAVNALETFLMVDFSDGSGREPFFYVRSDSYQWEYRNMDICCYLPEQAQASNVNIIPGPGRRHSAALHPFLISWSNTLLKARYNHEVTQRYVLDILKVIFGRVLRVNRNERIRATELRNKLATIQRDWSSYDLAPTTYEYRDISQELCISQNCRARGHGPSRLGQSGEPFPLQEPDARHSISETTIPPTTVADSQATRQDTQNNLLRPPHPSEHSMQAEWIQMQDTTAPTQDPITAIPQDQVQAQTGKAAAMEMEATEDQKALTPGQKVRMQENLRSAIERDDAASVEGLLRGNPEMLRQLLPDQGRYPIHWALFNGAYEALDALFEKASLEITKLEWNGRTALDLALDSGRPAALDCIRKHRLKFDFPLPLYEKRKKKLGREAKEIADDLFGIGNKQKRSFPWRKSQTSNPSA